MRLRCSVHSRKQWAEDDNDGDGDNDDDGDDNDDVRPDSGRKHRAAP